MLRAPRRVEGWCGMTVQIITADMFDALRELPSDSVDCVVTSPPYWGLRSYLPDGHQDCKRDQGTMDDVAAAKLEPTPLEALIAAQ
jgi:DNA modification methylase